MTSPLKKIFSTAASAKTVFVFLKKKQQGKSKLEKEARADELRQTDDKKIDGRMRKEGRRRERREYEILFVLKSPRMLAAAGA